MSTKTERFGMVLSVADKELLQRLADRERIPAAAVVRRLIWDAAQRPETPRLASSQAARR